MPMQKIGEMHKKQLKLKSGNEELMDKQTQEWYNNTGHYCVEGY